jgi:hypothetical protein
MFIRLWGTGHELLLIIMQFLRLTQLSACLEAPSWWPDDDWYVSEASKKSCLHSTHLFVCAPNLSCCKGWYSQCTPLCLTTGNQMMPSFLQRKVVRFSRGSSTIFYFLIVVAIWGFWFCTFELLIFLASKVHALFVYSWSVYTECNMFYTSLASHSTNW